MHDLKIPAKRGTNLYKNPSSSLTLGFKQDEMSEEVFQNILLLRDDILERVTHFPNFPSSIDTGMVEIEIGHHQKFMIINQTDEAIHVAISADPAELEVLYNPYLYENEEHENYDPEEFKKEHPVPDGYVDTLAKWYSIKFTYADENLIFIRPGLGISFQTHEERQEFWEVMEGSPIIISGKKVYYDTKVGDTFEHALGAVHTIINPTDEWVCIKEKYEGNFDEEDIERVFNPNHYF